MEGVTEMKKNTEFRKYWQFFWRSYAIQTSWNYERQMNMGFMYGIAPTLERLYPDESDPKQLEYKKEAYKRRFQLNIPKKENCQKRQFPAF